MGGYRDDLGAAVARADALQRRVDELEEEVERLRRGGAGAAPLAAAAFRARHNIGAYAVLGAMFMFVGLLVMLIAGWTIPEPAPPAPIYVQFEASP